MAEAQRALRVYLVTEEQISILRNFSSRFPNEPAFANALDLIGTQSIGMLPASDMGNQGQAQAQFEKYRTAIAAAIGEVEPGLVDDPESEQTRYRDSNPSSDSATERKESGSRSGF